MSVVPSGFARSLRTLLFGTCCATFIFSCDVPPPGSGGTPAQSKSKPSKTNEPPAEPGFPQPTIEATREAPQDPAQTTVVPTPAAAITKPLNLSRDHLNNSDQLTANDANIGKDPSVLLPDLFKEKKEAKTGPRASGRLLLQEDGAVSMETIEGVEFMLEVPIN